MTLYERLTPAAKKALLESAEEYPNTAHALTEVLKGHEYWTDVRWGDMDTLLCITGEDYPSKCFDEMEAGK